METNTLIDLVRSLCILVLSKNDSLELVLSKQEKEFLNNNIDILKSDDLMKLFKDNIDYLHLIVDKCCIEHTKEKITDSSVIEPFYFYDSQMYKSYYKELSDYFKKTFSADLPGCIYMVLEWISFKCEEFQNITIHVNGRIIVSNELAYDAFNTELEKSSRRLEKLNSDLKNVNKRYLSFDQELDDRQKKMTEQMITILGIFSAIVLTFNAGVSFSSIVMENLISSSFYRAIIITALLGLILGNVIIGLFIYLGRVHDQSNKLIKNVGRSRINTKSKRNSSWIVLVITDVLLLLTIIITAIGWKFGWIEDRDKDVYAESPPVTTQADPNLDIDLNGSLNLESTTTVNNN